MASLASLYVNLSANTGQFETDLKRAGDISKYEMRKMEREAKNLQKSWDQSFKVAGLAVAAGIGYATKAAADFEKAMAEVSTLLSTDALSSIDGLKSSVKNLSVEFGQAPTDQAKALYQIISAGAEDSATQVEQLTVANKLAVGGITDVEVAADGLTTVINAYAGSGLTAQNVSDILFATMKGGKTTIGELSGSIGNVATIAAQTGVDFNQLSAAVATLTKSGINTSQAMDGLRGVLSAVLKQSEQSVAMADELGVQFNAAALEARGLHGFLQDIAATNPTSEQLSKLFGRIEGLNAVMALGSQEMAEFTRQLDVITNSSGATDEAVSRMMDTTSQKAAQARAAIEVLSIEFGEKFLAAVSTAAELMVKYIDEIAAAIEALVYLLTARLAVMGVNAIATLITATSGASVAMAALGGPIGLAVLALTGLVIVIAEAVDGFKDLHKELDAITETIDQTTDAWIKHAQSMELVDRIEKLRDEWKKAENRIEELQAQMGRFDTANKAHVAEIERLRAAQAAAIEKIIAMKDELERASEESENAAESNARLSNAIEEMQPRIDAARQAFTDAAAALDQLVNEEIEAERQSYALMQSQRNANILWADSIDILDELIAEMEATEAANKSLSTAMDESIRILERTFTDVWSSILDGSEDAFDGILDGFKTLLSSMINEAITRPIVLNIQESFSAGGAGFAGLDYSALGNSIAAAAGVIFGSELGGGGTGSTLGSIAGALGGQALGEGLGWWLGSLGGPLGLVLGGALGGIVGGLVDDVLARDLVGTLGGVNRSTYPDNQALETALGTVLGLYGSGGFGDINDPSTPGGQIGAAIVEFDQQMADLISEIAGGDALAMVQDSLKDWEDTWTEGALTVENVLGSRFGAIVENFSADVQRFVASGSDLEDQVDRFGVALSVERLFAENPEVFADKAVGDFLDIVESFQSGTETMGEALNEVVTLLNRVIAAKASLEDFANSDLSADFDALVATAPSLSDALATMNEALADAIFNFDGSIESLEEIGLLSMAVREGELALLSEIDAIQKGINANLQDLKNEILGIEEVPMSIEDAFFAASGLVFDIREASSAAEIAALESEFSALLGQFAAEDLAAFLGPNGMTFVDIIDLFSSAANEELEALKDAAIDSSESMRQLVEDFNEQLADPIEFIADYNERTAEAVETIADNTSMENQQEFEQAIEDAIIRGFGQASVNVSVNIDARSLVNE